ncbi:glycosyltransferase [bacterium]|jgi:glycosyltransferase involved in cell wall biosynthesis|nr:glycosyltransferase [bacterium]
MIPEISIVMPTFKQSKYIDNTIESIISQNFENWELIIVVDGEDEETKKIVEKRQNKDDRIICRVKENGGTGSALNRGFVEAIGRFETWFASDNIMYPNCLKTLIHHLYDHLDIDLVYSNNHVGFMDETGLVEKERKDLTNILDIDQTWDIKKSLHNFYFGICWLWRRELRTKCGSFQSEPNEDYDMFLRMQEVGKFAHVPEILGWYRQHNENMTKKLQSGQAGDKFMYMAIDNAKKRRPDLYGV